MNHFDFPHIVAAFSDIKVILGTIGVGAVTAMQVVTFMKQLQTQKTVKHNSVTLHTLTHAVDEDIRSQIEILKKQNNDIQRTTAHLEELIERRQAQAAVHPGRRASDRTGDATMRRPVIAPEVHDPKAGYHRPMHEI